MGKSLLANGERSTDHGERPGGCVAVVGAPGCRVRVGVCGGCCSRRRCPVRAYVVQPLFGVAAVLPPTRFCRESRAYCYRYMREATLLARTCHFPFSKSILAPCAPPPPAQSTMSTLLRRPRAVCTCRDAVPCHDSFFSFCNSVTWTLFVAR